MPNRSQLSWIRGFDTSSNVRGQEQAFRASASTFEATKGYHPRPPYHRKHELV